MMKLAPLCCLLIATLFLTACSGGSRSDVSFQLRGVALDSAGVKSEDGTFVIQSYRVEPNEVRIVLGDLKLNREEPTQELRIFSSLAPILSPGQTLPSDQIGSQGRYPGLWAINLTPGATLHNFAPGRMETQDWKEIQLRFAPAVSGVRGLQSEALKGHTLLFDGNAQKGTTRCSLKIRLTFEGGIGQRIAFTVRQGQRYQNLILLNYARWFQDFPMEALCSKQPQVEVNATTNANAASLLQTGVMNSFSFQFESKP